MASLLGAVSFSGGPVDLNVSHSYAHATPPVGAFERIAGASIAVRSSPDEPSNDFALQSRAGVLYAASARLDNASDVRGSLAVAAAGPRDDSSLLIDAYDRWGTDCTDHLQGDWMLVAWHADVRRLVVARDHFGNSTFYFCRIGDRLAFASELPVLMTLPWIHRRPDDHYLAWSLVAGHVPTADSTPYAGVSRLPPAHRLEATEGRTTTTRYWRIETIPARTQLPMAEAVAHTRSLLDEAVRSRIASARRLGATLSSGLDSSSVTVLAARQARQSGARITALTGVPRFEVALQSGLIADEGPLARRVVDDMPNVEHVLVDAADVSPIDAMQQMTSAVGEPIAAALNGTFVIGILREAQSRDIDTLLVGQAGDFTMAGRRQAAPDGAPWFWRTARKYAAYSVGRMRQLHWRPWRLREPPWRSFSAASQAFTNELRFTEAIHDAGWDPAFLLPNRFDPGLIRHQASTPAMGLWKLLGNHFRMAVRDPLSDVRLVEFVHSLPPALIEQPLSRLVFREAMAGLLPDAVRLAPSKAVQGSDVAIRLAAVHDELWQVLDDLGSSSIVGRCIDLAYCRRLAGALVRDPQRTERREIVALMTALNVGMFLERTIERRP